MGTTGDWGWIGYPHGRRIESDETFGKVVGGVFLHLSEPYCLRRHVDNPTCRFVVLHYCVPATQCIKGDIYTLSFDCKQLAEKIYVADLRSAQSDEGALSDYHQNKPNGFGFVGTRIAYSGMIFITGKLRELPHGAGDSQRTL